MRRGCLQYTRRLHGVRSVAALEMIHNFGNRNAPLHSVRLAPNGRVEMWAFVSSVGACGLNAELHMPLLVAICTSRNIASTKAELVLAHLPSYFVRGGFAKCHVRAIPRQFRLDLNEH